MNPEMHRLSQRASITNSSHALKNDISTTCLRDVKYPG
jgi:hypothetical protein